MVIAYVQTEVPWAPPWHVPPLILHFDPGSQLASIWQKWGLFVADPGASISANYGSALADGFMAENSAARAAWGGLSFVNRNDHISGVTFNPEKNVSANRS